MVETELVAQTAAATRHRDEAWFCVRTQPKHEHIAAANLRQDAKIEVFLPRIRFKRRTRQGLVWVTEALFPNYLLAKFDLQTCLRQVHHARGVRGVVHFGARWPSVPESTVDELRATVGMNDVHVITAEPQPGDKGVVVAGAFQGWQAVITRVMPAKQRVAVLLNFLGQQTAVELDRHLLVLEREGSRFAL